MSVSPQVYEYPSLDQLYFTIFNTGNAVIKMVLIKLCKSWWNCDASCITVTYPCDKFGEALSLYSVNQNNLFSYLLSMRAMNKSQNELMAFVCCDKPCF